MFFRISNLIIMFITPLVWRIFPNRKARSLQSFSYIEKDSAVQLLQCLKIIDDKHKADIFQHVLEELYHSDLFDYAAKSVSVGFLNVNISSRENLIGDKISKDELLSFYSYVHVGEKEVDQDFLVYSKIVKNESLKKIFIRVSGDEFKHKGQTERILLELSSGQRIKKSFYIFKSYLTRSLKISKGFVRGTIDLVLTAFLTIVYYISGLYLRSEASRQLTLSANEQMELFKKQIDINKGTK